MWTDLINLTMSSPVYKLLSAPQFGVYRKFTLSNFTTATSIIINNNNNKKSKPLKLRYIEFPRSMATETVEYLPPPLDATAEQPAIFDGTTRLYMSYTCPFAQRVWITRNYKGLQDKIKLVPLNLQNKPAWYKEKVYPENKVPSLEHHGKVIGDSLDLIQYVDSNFEGPSLLPTHPEKRMFFEELLSHTDEFAGTVFGSFKGDSTNEAGAAFDHLENALTKFDGPFLLGNEFSLADIAYVTLVERFQIYLSDVFNYDITAGRPKLAAWIEAVNEFNAYKQTKKTDPKELVELYKKLFSEQM